MPAAFLDLTLEVRQEVVAVGVDFPGFANGAGEEIRRFLLQRGNSACGPGSLLHARRSLAGSAFPGRAWERELETLFEFLDDVRFARRSSRTGGPPAKSSLSVYIASLIL